MDQGWVALHQMLQAGLHCVEVVESMHAVRAASEFTGSLRASQKQEAKDGRFVAVEIEGFLQTVLVFCHPAVRRTNGSDERLCLQGAQRIADGRLIQIHDRVAIRLLVAGIDQRVQGQWIILWGSNFLLDERPQDSAFHFTQDDVHGQKSYNRTCKNPAQSPCLADESASQNETADVPKRAFSFLPIFRDVAANP